MCGDEGRSKGKQVQHNVEHELLYLDTGSLATQLFIS
jgi:hypothetical protein